MAAAIRKRREYMGVTINYHPDYRSRFTGTAWRWSTGNLYANTLAGIKQLIREDNRT